MSLSEGSGASKSKHFTKKTKLLTRAEFKKEGVVLPSKFNRASSLCLNDKMITKFLCRIQNVAEANPAAFLCAFIAFQRRRAREYTGRDVDSRFAIFSENVRKNDRLVHSYSDLTEDEQADQLNKNPRDDFETFSCKVVDLREKNKYGKSGVPIEILNGKLISIDDLEAKGYYISSSNKNNNVSIQARCVDDPKSELKKVRSLGKRVHAAACAFVAFQASDVKSSEPYTVDTVDARAENFINCLKDAYRCYRSNPRGDYAITRFCDLSEEERNAIVEHDDSCQYWLPEDKNMEDKNSED